ncbi:MULTISPECIES: hypothetical protein [Bacillales]|jgi:uncharacterized membrane protein YgcG|uniref:Methanol dehydrogenase n=1 Tax=Brevibacillus aydinogluensis TaxID=927786 RepID=A0AA48M5C9_9BACL|nr:MULTISPECIES: hypothetical protein [Bacillales]REK65143.1 MAG: hypothetical protein DF221_06175 [Brevibacillus sp.]MBR8658688.1 hypothetical protein [Brevibacillus sp. NL20B1]MDT3416008.1 putative membrane protein YgcG [Brevibacillus aydinogluensis]NNV03072.1 hypothetical protein [Brevibacillus sp. MCWH]UFJ61555.1 hypothetical protein IRT44_01480 [Anoxybacillus sediminis]
MKAIIIGAVLLILLLLVLVSAVKRAGTGRSSAYGSDSSSSGPFYIDSDGKDHKSDGIWGDGGGGSDGGGGD